MNGQLNGLLGLAVRARQAALGADACDKMIRSGQCGVLMMDEQTGNNTRKRIEALCERAETPVRMMPAGTLQAAAGRDNMLIAIRRGGFAEEILRRTAAEAEGQTTKTSSCEKHFD